MGGLCFAKQARADFDETNARVTVIFLAKRLYEAFVFLLEALIPVFRNFLAIASDFGRRIAFENVWRHTHTTVRSIVDVETDANSFPHRIFFLDPVLKPGPVVDVGTGLEHFPLGGNVAANDRVYLGVQVAVIVENINAGWARVWVIDERIGLVAETVERVVPSRCCGESSARHRLGGDS